MDEAAAGLRKVIEFIGGLKGRHNSKEERLSHKSNQ